MKFELKDYHRNIDKAELINDLRTVSRLLNKKYISKSEYEKNGKYSASPFLRNFGSWIASLEAAGLNTEREAKEYKRISDDDLLKDVKCVCQLLQKGNVTTRDYSENGNYSVQTLLNRFLTWNNVLKKAGLASSNHPQPITNEALFLEIERMWIAKGEQPTTSDIKNGKSIYSLNTYIRRFGGWRNTLLAFLKWISTETDESNMQSKLDYNNMQNLSKHSNECQIINSSQKKLKSTHRTQREVNARLRFQVLKRDHFKCCACGASPAKDPSIELHVDHIIPWSKGGETVLENLQTLCSKCNLGKSDSI